jgi:hypothetical protein
MRTTTVHSVCECQARLAADLDENRLVLRGVASVGGDREPAPAHSIGADGPRFDIGWLCPFCGRNTLRSFASDALVWSEVTAPPPAPPSEGGEKAA